jgi:hypothetical protein
MGVLKMRGKKSMRTWVVFGIMVSLFFSMVSGAGSAHFLNVFSSENDSDSASNNNGGSDVVNTASVQATVIPQARLLSNDISIDDPEEGYLYFLNNGKKEFPILGIFDYSIVVYENLKIYATINGGDHVKFVAKQLSSGEETTLWDCEGDDGFSVVFLVPSGRYYITATSFDEQEQQLSSDSARVFFLKLGQGDAEDSGVWIHATYNGAIRNKKLGVGLLDFKQMIDTGVTKEFSLSLDSKDDTVVALSFSRTQILLDDGSPTDVVQAQLNVDTAVDTTEDYSVGLEVRFPFSVLKDDTVPISSGEPYFCTRIGFASPENNRGPTNVHARFFFGKESLADPAVFRMHVTPNNLEDHPTLTYYNSYTTTYSTGEEVFNREFSVAFEPAVELEVTSIPGVGKIQYAFGESAGVTTKISFSADGGLLDNIMQSFTVDPLPSRMSFDLTLLGEQSFVYESDTSYDVSYALESELHGELMKLQFDDLPMTIHASRDVTRLGGLAASGFVDLDMSSDIQGVSLYLLGSEIPFIAVEHFPKKLRLDGLIDLDAMKGSLEFTKEYEAIPSVTASLAFDRWVLSDTVTLDSEYVKVFCDLGSHVALGVRTDETVLIRDNIFTVYDHVIDGNVFQMGFDELETNDLQLSWDRDGMGHMSNFNWFGGIKKLKNLQIAVNTDGNLFELSGTLNLFSNGSLFLTLNKDVNISFDGIENSLFKIQGYLDIAADRELHLGWDWNDNGYVVMESTGGYFGRKAGITLECIWDEDQNDYLYGISITAQHFPDQYRRVWWDHVNGLHIWITGGLLPVDWQIELKVDGEWCNQGSFEYV